MHTGSPARAVSVPAWRSAAAPAVTSPTSAGPAAAAEQAFAAAAPATTFRNVLLAITLLNLLVKGHDGAGFRPRPFASGAAFSSLPRALAQRSSSAWTRAPSRLDRKST